MVQLVINADLKPYFHGNIKFSILISKDSVIKNVSTNTPHARLQIEDWMRLEAFKMF
jgi:hypothetical protein